MEWGEGMCVVGSVVRRGRGAVGENGSEGVSRSGAKACVSWGVSCGVSWSGGRGSRLGVAVEWWIGREGEYRVAGIYEAVVKSVVEW